jgi:hypothetical protein
MVEERNGFPGGGDFAMAIENGEICFISRSSRLWGKIKIASQS